MDTLLIFLLSTKSVLSYFVFLLHTTHYCCCYCYCYCCRECSFYPSGQFSPWNSRVVSHRKPAAKDHRSVYWICGINKKFYYFPTHVHYACFPRLGCVIHNRQSTGKILWERGTHEGTKPRVSVWITAYDVCHILFQQNSEKSSSNNNNKKKKKKKTTEKDRSKNTERNHAKLYSFTPPGLTKSTLDCCESSAEGPECPRKQYPTTAFVDRIFNTCTLP